MPGDVLFQSCPLAQDSGACCEVMLIRLRHAPRRENYLPFPCSPRDPPPPLPLPAHTLEGTAALPMPTAAHSSAGSESLSASALPSGVRTGRQALVCLYLVSARKGQGSQESKNRKRSTGSVLGVSLWRFRSRSLAPAALRDLGFPRLLLGDCSV